MNLFAVNRDTTTVVGFRRLNLKYIEKKKNEKKCFLKEKFCFKKEKKVFFLTHLVVTGSIWGPMLSDRMEIFFKGKKPSLLLLL